METEIPEKRARAPVWYIWRRSRWEDSIQRGERDVLCFKLNRSWFHLQRQQLSWLQSFLRTHQASVFLEDKLLQHLFNREGDDALLQLKVDLAHLLVPAVNQIMKAVDEVHHLGEGGWKIWETDTKIKNLCQVQSLCLLKMLARAKHLFLKILPHTCILVAQRFVIILMERRNGFAVLSLIIWKPVLFWISSQPFPAPLDLDFLSSISPALLIWLCRTPLFCLSKQSHWYVLFLISVCLAFLSILSTHY